MAAAALRALLATRELHASFDAASAKLIAANGFRVSFLSGFSVSAARLGLPDTGQMLVRNVGRTP